MQSISNDQPIEAQIHTFLNVVEDVNKIPGVMVSLSKEIDRQRDALAFAVNETFIQFVGSNWKLALTGFQQKINEMSSINDPKLATIEIANLIKHLFEARLHAFEVTSDDKSYEKTFILYQATMSSIIDKTPAGKPVNFSGIPLSLLPPWYLAKSYLH